ncbi:MAG: type II secretion system inner membrane protein GspF [Planctomycetes bacterium]|jgi:general secretion pathway protein F|nr:type II secretion system inner membrane protein GspF [Planctomycetota bacterium]
MPIFEYKAVKGDGATVTGILDADTAKDARTVLRNKRLHVTDIRPVEDVGREEKRRRLPSLFRRKHRGEIAMVTRQLATMLKAGIPLAQSLNALVEQSGTRDIEAILRDTREKVLQGAGLAEALAFHPSYFSELYVNMVRAGEASGNLDVVLSRLADYGQKQNRLRAKVKAALTYPAVMVVFGILVVLLLTGFVVPKIVDVLRSAKRDAVLPVPTRILMTFSQFLTSYWWLLIAIVITLVILVRLLLRDDRYRFGWDRLKLRFPIVGELLRRQSVSRFAITLSTLLKSGIPALQALNIVKNVVDNLVMKKVVQEVHDRILEGADISTPLKKSGIFPPVVGYMVSIGEQSGQLEEILDRISESYDEEIEITIQKVTSLIEPILIVFLAVAVGFVIVSVLLPILEIGQSI